MTSSDTDHSLLFISDKAALVKKQFSLGATGSNTKFHDLSVFSSCGLLIFSWLDLGLQQVLNELYVFP